MLMLLHHTGSSNYANIPTNGVSKNSNNYNRKVTAVVRIVINQSWISQYLTTSAFGRTCHGWHQWHRGHHHQSTNGSRKRSSRHALAGSFVDSFRLFVFKNLITIVRNDVTTGTYSRITPICWHFFFFACCSDFFLGR